MKIYTKTGDSGQTGLFGGARVSKDDVRVEAYGTVDELNSFIGLFLSKIQEMSIIRILQMVQNDLFVIGSYLAADPNKPKIKLPLWNSEHTMALEKSIDEMELVIPALTAFVLPSGSETIGLAHVCRTVCRRAERRMVSVQNISNLDPEFIMYINRLSDWFFVCSRFLAYHSGLPETPWVPLKS